MKRRYLRGQLFYADLGSPVGSEQGGVRPVLVIQNSIGNKHSTTLVVAVLSGHIKKMYLPTHVLAPADLGLHLPSMVMTEQLRTIDKKRIQGYIGTADSRLMDEVERSLCVSCGLDLERLCRREGWGDSNAKRIRLEKNGYHHAACQKGVQHE